MNRAVAEALAAALGTPVVRTRALGGGDINEAYAAELADGRAVFVKTNARAAPTMFAREADGLGWLAEAGAIRVPKVVALSAPDSVGKSVHWLALELIVPGPRQGKYEEILGQRLAALHRHGAPCFGWDRDNFIGSLPQANTPWPTWAEFYAHERLLPQVRRAVDEGRAPASWVSAFGRLCDKLDGLVGPAEPPARLHGDLWSGNLHTDERGEPCLIDPAVYGGHREVDLAMLDLFGGVSRRFLDAYDEAYPLAPGRAERVALYQLYPLLVHVNLFGGGYVRSVQDALRRYADGSR